MGWHHDNAIKVNFEGQISGREDFHKQIVLGLKKRKKGVKDKNKYLRMS